MNYSPSSSGILTPDVPVAHRDDEYDPAGFDVLREMQERHFWYEGRHRFLLRAVQDELERRPHSDRGIDAIDLGGGCGGWIAYLKRHCPRAFSKLALADSSARALDLAGPVIGAGVERYQVDLLSLGWEDRWDAAFLLDVLEHIPEDSEVLRQVWRALKPGGLLFVTTPALQCFWSYNDEMAHHVRRYSKADFAQLARTTGFSLRQARYFMFLLSPLLWLTRLKRRNLSEMSRSQIRELARKTHRIPPAPLNAALQFIFGLETPAGLRLRFPWGTSILGVFERPF